MIPPLTVRPVVHTAHLAEWVQVFRALGAVTLSTDPMWTELQVDRGRVTLTELNRDAVEGDVALGFETPDLDAFASAVLPLDGMVVEEFVTADYTSLRVVGRDGMEFLIDERLPGPPVPEGATTSIRAIWTTPAVARAARDLEALGLRRRPTQTDDHGIDLRAAEGDVLVRVGGGAVEAEVAVVVADIDAAHDALLGAGIVPDVVDETRGRVLQVPLPGGGEGRLRISALESA